MPTYIGENKIVDRYLGDKFLEAAYIGDEKVYDPYTEITGYLPMIFKSRAAVALKNYRIHGTSEGAGVETESGEPAGYKIPISLQSGNLWNGNNIQNGIFLNSDGTVGYSDGWSVSTYQDVVPLNKYLFDPHTTAGGTAKHCFYDESKQFISSIDSGMQVFTVPHNANYIRFSFRAESTNITFCNQSNYDLFIGDSKLMADEFVDYGEQKIYKDVLGTLTPTDPPAPLPAIQTYQGENTLSSTETVGEVTVKGRISASNSTP